MSRRRISASSGALSKKSGIGFILVFIAWIFSSIWVLSAEPTATPKKPSLVEAAKAAKMARERSSNSVRTPRIISNETLYADRNRGHITMNEEVYTAPNVHDGNTSKMEYWRQRYREQRTLIGKIEAEIEELDTTLPILWRDFYAIDDVDQRDQVIKPKLGAALRQKRDKQEQLGKEEEMFMDILRQARLDGALPGWFRDLR